MSNCWGEEAAKAADDAKSVEHVCKHVVDGVLCNRSITAAFE